MKFKILSFILFISVKMFPQFTSWKSCMTTENWVNVGTAVLLCIWLTSKLEIWMLFAASRFSGAEWIHIFSFKIPSVEWKVCVKHIFTKLYSKGCSEVCNMRVWKNVNYNFYLIEGLRNTFCLKSMILVVKG
jgi:hypothetical protein